MKTTYDFEDSGEATFPTINSELLEETLQIMTLPALKKQAVNYELKGMQQTWLKPEFYLLFDVIHKVLLYQ